MSNNAIISRNKCEKISCLFFRELNNTMKITETNRGKSDRKNAVDHRLELSETGIYAYAAIYSITLAELFPNEWNKDFNRRYLELLCHSLGVNEKMKPVMYALAEGHSNQTQENYVELLKQDPLVKGKLIIIVQHLVMIGVQEGEYDARQRVLVRRLSELLKVPFGLVELYEHSLIELLNHDVGVISESEQGEVNRRDKIRKIKRYASIGIATIAGGTLVGLTGGLAAPFIGAGLGAILGSASAAAVSTTVGVAIIGSLFGVAGAGLTGYKMNKRVGEVEEFSFVPLNEKLMTEELHVAIAVTGWLTDEKEDNVVRPWNSLDITREQYAVQYETKYLLELGQALDYILSMAVSVATQEALKYTVLSSLMAAVTWPAALLSISSVIDNPWSVCCRRSSEVGKELANVLRTRQHGKRPVTLVGFSLGARVIFYCLRDLAEVGGAEGIVQDAIMLGAPVTSSKSQWVKCSRVVAGNMINGYCRADWLLKFLYRTLSMTTGVAGLLPVECERVKNVDLSSIVTGHREYSEKLTELLQFIGVRTKDRLAMDLMKKSASAMSCTEGSTPAVTESKMKPSKSDTCLPKVRSKVPDRS